MKSSKAHCDKLKPGHLKNRIIGCQVPFSFAVNEGTCVEDYDNFSVFHIHDYLLM